MAAGTAYYSGYFLDGWHALFTAPVCLSFKTMERRLLKYIMTPAMTVSWVFGLSMLLANPGMMSGAGWMHVKMLLVVLMSGVHGMFAAHVRRFANDENVKDAKFFRILNEAPTILMIIIVIMAVVQPF